MRLKALLAEERIFCMPVTGRRMIPMVSGGMPPQCQTMILRARSRRHMLVAACLALFLGTATVASAAAGTLEAAYPGVAQGFLRSALLELMDEDILLESDGVRIGRDELVQSIQGQDPKLQRQLESNLLFALEQLATRRFLVREAHRTAAAVPGGEDAQAIKALFAQRTQAVSVTDAEVRAFYQANTEMMDGAAFEQVQDGIRQYLLQDKKEKAVAAYLDDLSQAAGLRVNAAWVDAQSRLAVENPVDQARRSGRPSMVEFGAAGCVPCDMMQPILDNLRRNYPDKLNVVFVHVGEERVLASRYGIRSIPVQVFFDAGGQEVFRHVGFFPEAEVSRQLAQMGVHQ